MKRPCDIREMTWQSYTFENYGAVLIIHYLNLQLYCYPSNLHSLETFTHTHTNIHTHTHERSIILCLIAPSYDYMSTRKIISGFPSASALKTLKLKVFHIEIDNIFETIYHRYYHVCQCLLSIVSAMMNLILILFHGFAMVPNNQSVSQPTKPSQLFRV